MSSLRMLYEHILGVPLDRGNFRRQFLEVVDLGPLVALPIFQRGVPHRAGQLFTFDHRGRERWSHAGGDIASTCGRLKTASGGRAHRLAVNKVPAARRAHTRQTNKQSAARTALVFNWKSA